MKPAPLTRNQQHLNRVETLKGELRALERLAGISEAVERWASSGSESFDGLREIVSAVPNEGARRELIDKMREMDAEGIVASKPTSRTRARIWRKRKGRGPRSRG